MNTYQLRRLARHVCSVSVAVLAWTGTALALTATGTRLASVEANDNQRPAGTLESGTLTLALRAGVGAGSPRARPAPRFDRSARRSLVVADRSRRRSSASSKAPVIVASIRNDLDAPLTVHGLCARDGTPCAPLTVAPGETREVRFSQRPAGTYHYWATTFGAPVPFRELSGAFVVDPPGGAPEADRDLRHHRVVEPDAGAGSRGMTRGRCDGSVRQDEPAL